MRVQNQYWSAATDISHRPRGRWARHLRLRSCPCRLGCNGGSLSVVVNALVNHVDDQRATPSPPFPRTELLRQPLHQPAPSIPHTNLLCLKLPPGLVLLHLTDDGVTALLLRIQLGLVLLALALLASFRCGKGAGLNQCRGIMALMMALKYTCPTSRPRPCLNAYNRSQCLHP